MAGISGIFCAWLGLSLSRAASLPAGPSIVLTASALFFISILFGTRSRLAGSLRALFNARGNDETYGIRSGARAGDDVANGDGENAQCGDQLFHTGDMTREVGGDHVNVTTLVGPDGDPHTFEPSPKDSAALSKADVVVVNGLGLEGWLDRPVKASGFKGQLVVASRGVQTHTLEEEGKTVTDPHARNSAANGALYAQNILNGLVKADPEDKTALEATGEPYIAQLKQLDSWAKTRFSQIPLVKRKVLTSHDAFGYFSRAYGVTFMAPQGCRQRARPARHRSLRSLIRLKRTA